MGRKYHRELELLSSYLRGRGVPMRHMRWQDAEDFRAQWHEAFLPPHYQREVEINPNYLVWQAFSSGKVKCLEREEARDHFLRHSRSLRTLWFCGFRSLGAFIAESPIEKFDAEVADGMSEISGIFSDSVWTGHDLAWTYLTTHEENWGLGPYFVERESVGEAP